MMAEIHTFSNVLKGVTYPMIRPCEGRSLTFVETAPFRELHL